MDKLRLIQKQCQYSIDKLLDHAKRSIFNENSNNNNNINDELSHKPDIDTLRPPDDDDDDNDDDDNDDNDIEINENDDMDMYKSLESSNSMLTKKQERMRQKLRKKVQSHDIYQSIKENMTNLPKEERFFLENVDKFSSSKHSENRSKSRLKDMENYEEDNYRRLKQSRSEFKKSQMRKRYKESSRGQDLNSFVDNLDKSYRDIQKLGDFEAGGKFNDTIGKNNKKKKLKGGKYIKGPWQKRQKILFKNSKKGQKIESRRKWRKAHPLKTNPAKAARMKNHRFKKSSKVRKLLKKIK